MGSLGYGYDFQNSYSNPIKNGSDVKFDKWKGKSIHYGFHAERLWLDKQIGFLFGLSTVYYSYDTKKAIAEEIGTNSISFIDFIFHYRFPNAINSMTPYLGVGGGIGLGDQKERLGLRQLIKGGMRFYLDSSFLFTELQYQSVETRKDAKLRDRIQDVVFHFGYGVNLESVK